MLVSARVAFAVRCPKCGKLEINNLSLFDFSGAGSVHLNCSCGAHKLTIGKRRGGQYWLQVPCYLCDGMHITYYSAAEFWRSALSRVVCAETDLQLGVFGQETEVQSYIPPALPDMDRMLEDAAAEDYFENPEVMYRALSHVHSTAAAGLVTCQCGNHQVEVDIFADRLELTCPECGASRAIDATSPEDLAELCNNETLWVGEAEDSSPEGTRQSRSSVRRSHNQHRKK